MHSSNGRVSAGNGVTRESIASWAIWGVIRVEPRLVTYRTRAFRGRDWEADYTNVRLEARAAPSSTAAVKGYAREFITRGKGSGGIRAAHRNAIPAPSEQSATTRREYRIAPLPNDVVSRSLSAPISKGPAIWPMTAAEKTITDDATARIRGRATLIAAAKMGPWWTRVRRLVNARPAIHKPRRSPRRKSTSAGASRRQPIAGTQMRHR